MRNPWIVACSAVLLLALVLAAVAQTPDDPPRGPFGLSLVSTPDGHPTSISDFYLSEDCGLCHEKQLEDFMGSMHSAAHHDPLYRAFAELAREEAGEEIYAYCSGCHTPGGVTSGLVPGKDEAKLPEVATAGVTCDVCHLMTEHTGFTGPWGEPGNASFVLSPGRTRYGNIEEIVRNPTHTGAKLEFYSKSEYCASCHTIIHPLNGLRIEHTYDEWKGSVYAEKGIQCQHCHMRSVEDAAETARTLKPSVVLGTVLRKGPERELNPHYFVGANANAGLLANGPRHAEMAVARLKSAAELEIQAPKAPEAGKPLEFNVVVRNIGAGHNLPTSLTELRRMWVEVRVTAADGREILASGVLDEHGEIPEGSFWFGATLIDKEGEVTFRPWEGVGFSYKRLIPPKAEDFETFRVTPPEGAAGPFTIRTRLLYTSAPRHVVNEVMGEEAFEPVVVEMATAEATVR